MTHLNQIIFDAGFLPILFAEKGCAEQVVAAIEDTPIPAVEILQRGPEAEQVLIDAVRAKKHAYIGAGTVCTLDHCKRMVDLGADFIVSPGFNPEMVNWCVANHVPVVPGVTNPSEVMLSQNAGLELVKFFPYWEMGGEKTMNAISGPFPNIKFVITGMLGEKDLHLVANHKIAGIGGVWMFQGEEDRTVEPVEEIKLRIRRSMAAANHYRNL